MSITAHKSGKLLRSRNEIWRVNASLDRSDILYGYKTAWGTISTSYLSDDAISIRSRHIALSMDACKLHSNSLTAGTAMLAGWLGALCILRGCNGGGQVPETRMYGGRVIICSPLFLLLFHRSALVHDTPRLRGTMIRDRHEYNPSCPPPPFLSSSLLRLLHETLSAFRCSGAVRATMWSWQIPWWSLILFKPVWPLTCYMTTIPSYDLCADVCVVGEDRSLFFHA